jgi:ABC-type multidrug transport system fused ATPase/permease subunit
MSGAAPPARLSFVDVIRLSGRALRSVEPFKGRLFAKWCFNLISLLPVLYVPWPLKVLVDHVVTNRPITPQALARYPFYFRPFVASLAGQPPARIALAVLALGLVTVVLLGVFGQGAAAQENTSVTLGDGQDTAGRSENQANIGFSFGGGLYGLIEYHWQLRLSQAINHFYRSQLFDAAQRLPMPDLDGSRIGDLVYRVMYDTPSITSLVYDLLLTPMTIGTFLAIVWVMNLSFGAAPEVVWIAAAVFPVYFLLQAPFSGMIRSRSGASRAAGGHAASALEEAMSNIFAVQSLGGWGPERARFDAASRAAFRSFRRLAVGATAYTLSGALGGIVLYVLVSLLIANRIIEGTFTLGDYAVLTFYYLWMSGAAGNLATMWTRLQDNAAGLSRVFEIIDRVPDGAAGGETVATLAGGVRLEGVSLVYPSGAKALAEVDFEARVGELTAIVGPTGSGKTSLAFLLPRFLRPTAGRVLFDGRDIAGAALDSLRSQIAYVFQETRLIETTVLENLRYGRPEASRAEVMAAARIAGAHDFIAALPQGYDTELGAGGGKLSVGQRQRIAIARGLVRGGKLLILDEPTSALDPHTEALLVDALRTAAQDRAVIVIAHRISTIVAADRIVFLDRGRVVETGSHAELVARGGAYAGFVALQR